MSLQALLGVVRHLVVERIGVDVNYEVVRHLFGLLGSGWVKLAGLRHPIRPRQERVHNLIGEFAGVGHLGQQPLDVKPGIEPVALAVVVTLYIAADARAPRGASLKSQFLRPTTKIRWACSATLFESSRCPSSSTFMT